ncbi:MAG: hypothetical protein B7Z02_12330 [Rhodobacterales bacterium 32-67-9]|nr:MAG: hypothetical protein B7Z02_12330 [Rhodobacterales bacterium 32-67-9]
MTRTRDILRRFRRDEDGTTLVELAIVIPLFLLIFFALVDFGRMGAEYVMADKAMQLASRIAVVRPPACASVPTFNPRAVVAPNTVPPAFGTKCASGGAICASPAPVSCVGSPGDPTAAEIWTAISPLMPQGSSVGDLWFEYAFDPNLNFLGGPYVPVVTVEIRNLNFQFVTPLGGLAALATGGAGTGPGTTLPFPAMSMSLPGEDLDLGENG